MSYHDVVASGDLDQLKVYTKKFGVYFDESVVTTAAEYGHLHILKWFQSIGYSLKPRKYMRDLCGHAALHGHYDTVKWLENQGHKLSYNTLFSSVSGGNLEAVMWIFGQRDSFECYNEHSPELAYVLEHMMEKAVTHGHLHILKWVYDIRLSQGVSHPVYVLTRTAAAHGHLHIIQWMHSIPSFFYWDPFASENAARSGHLHVLQWCNSNNFALRFNSLCEIALANMQWHIAHWLIANKIVTTVSQHIQHNRVSKKYPLRYYDAIQWLIASGKVDHALPLPLLNQWIQSIDSTLASILIPLDLIRLIKHFV